ncbi:MULTISPECIES: PaaX family transcriptional regulator C-terminal domain-containing protein [unclassified Sinorhizobium]|uniref:PaaX family transcriptional regulator C-terminal domain-containing protein n=1 Tax=unclassified Sinorhizobium TaxID=2613772 RepID=UPI0035264E6C
MAEENSKRHSSAERAVSALLDDKPIKAASFIVTVYGDAVEPRGGVVWIGNLIEVCGAVGISETLVRTAVSRLVRGGQLVGERSGKRSFYRLTPSARVEFSLAAQQLFSPGDHDRWRFICLTGVAIEDEVRDLERHGYARLTGDMLVGLRPLPPTMNANAIVFDASISEGEAFLCRFAGDRFALAPLAESYRTFIDRYSKLATGQVTGPDALSLRLLLVHDFRSIVLRDPNLPVAALPDDWPGIQARRLFSKRYLDWSAAADRQIGLMFVNEGGRLLQQTHATTTRENQLQAYST